MKKLTLYLMAGVIALGGISCKKEYEVRKVEGGREKLEKIVKDEEVGLEETIKRMFSCKPENCDFALKHVYLPRIHEKYSGNELIKIHNELLEDYKALLIAEQKEEAGEKFEERAREKLERKLDKWEESVIRHSDAETFEDFSCSCLTQETREKIKGEYPDINFKEIAVVRIGKPGDFGYKGKEERLSEVLSKRDIYKVKISAEILAEGEIDKWNDSFYFTKINNLWLFVDD